MDIKDIQNRFTYHAPKLDQLDKYTEIRACALNFALNLNMLCPDSREKSLALTVLETAVMYALKSLLTEVEKEALPEPCGPCNNSLNPQFKIAVSEKCDSCREEFHTDQVQTDQVKKLKEEINDSTTTG